jgi:hypothetical protein
MLWYEFWSPRECCCARLEVWCCLSAQQLDSPDSTNIPMRYTVYEMMLLIAWLYLHATARLSWCTSTKQVQSPVVDPRNI